MPNYTLELELFSSYATDVPGFQIWAEGALLGGVTYSVTSGGYSISVSPFYAGSLPTSLEFRFTDASAEVPRTIEIRSVKINDQYINTGNYLSSDSLTNGQTATVDIDSVNTDDSDFIFDDSDPAASEFTTGATETFTPGNDTYRRYNDTDDEVFDMLGGRDVAHLGSGDDKVSGGAGNDIIKGGAGEDLLYGDADNDRIHGGDDDDTIYGGTGNDRLHGEGGNDEIHGGAGNDRLNGHEGNDVITGGTGNDKLHGGDGNDYLFGGGDDDQLVSGSGDDTIDGGDGNDIAYGGAGIDHINGGDGDDILIGNQGNDVIHGNDNDDIIHGLEDNDEIHGGNGQDIIYGGSGNDNITGGDGDDIISATENVLDVVAALGTGNYQFSINGTIQTLHVDYDGTDHWLLVGRGREDWEFDTDGQGTIANMTAGLGTTAAFAPVAYDDTFVNNLITATGNDLTDTQIRLKRAANTTGTKWQEVRWDSISETDWTFDFDGANYDVEHRVFDSVLGTAFTDTTSRTRDTMSTPGSDTGNNYQRVWDFQWGGKGNIQGFSYGSSVQGIDNDDANTFLWENTTEGHATPYTEVYVRLDVATAVLNSTLGDDVIDGGDGNDTIIEDLGNDTIDGGDGNDTISSGAGMDILDGGAGNDTINGGDNNDTINGGDDNDTIDGGGGIDTLEGDAGDDIIRGGAGNDIIYANANTGIYDADWDFKRSITIDSSFIDSDMTDFTVLITEAGLDAHFWSNVKADGSDILITLGDGITVLDREVVDIDTVAETLQLHVRVPNLSSTVDTELKLHYGNAGVTLTNDTTTFGENYTGVWHLDDDLTGTVIEDSSRSQLDGTARGGLAAGDIVTAQVGDGLGFNGTSDYISLQHNYDTTTSLAGVSVTAWINTTVTGVAGFGNWAILDFDRSEFFNVFIDSNTGQLSFSTAAPGIDDFSGGANIADGNWHHIAAVYDGTDKILYVDGVEVARKLNPHGGAAITDTTTRFGFIGDGSEAGGENGGRNNIYYDGEADDVRLYEGVLTADEIAAQFDNQNNPSTFYSVGAVETTTITETDDTDTLYGGDGDDILYASSGGDTLYGEDGFDTLYGGSGVDTFVLEADSAYNDVDEIINFRFSEGDILDVSDLITGTFSGTITDYLQFTDSGTDTLIQFDANGLTGGSSFSTVGQINNITGLDEATLYTDGNIVV